MLKTIAKKTNNEIPVAVNTFDINM